MKSSNHIQSIYEQLKQLYCPETREILSELFTSKKPASGPKVMFPPLEGVTFDVAQAEAGFLKDNIAILTAFRATRSIEENRNVNERLKEELTKKGLKFYPVDGCFREALEDEPSKEDSFFVYDNNSHNALEFFMKVFKLSEKYEQDSFLYKSAGMNRTAYLISTNKDSRTNDGDIKLAGKLYLNLPPIGPYSKLPSGCIHFIQDITNNNII